MNKDNWFEKLTGIPEKKWNYDIKSLKNCEKYMGSFEEIKLSDLIKELETFIASGGNVLKKLPTLTFVLRGDKSDELEFDTSALQHYGPHGAMYQVASNFNCMEVPHEKSDVFSGDYIRNTIDDCTQGPSAAGGAAPGEILRVAIHYMKRINLLSETNLDPKNGKLYMDRVSAEDIANLDIGSIKVGLHTDVSAIFDRSINFSFNPDAPVIDQVYTSTCICRKREPNKLSEILLNAAYELTYLCAVKRRSKKLVLTLIGGGCFMNSYDQIIKAILSAHEKYGKYLVKDCDVVLPVYDRKISYMFKNISKEYVATRES